MLVTAGPTQEALDPVRFLTNHSTGTRGYAVARAAVLFPAPAGPSIAIFIGMVFLLPSSDKPARQNGLSAISSFLI